MAALLSGDTIMSTNTASHPALDHVVRIAAGGMEPARHDREHRRFRRAPSEAWAAFVAEAPAGASRRSVTVRVREVSAGGLSGSCGSRLTPGERGSLLVQRAGGELAILGAEVVHSGPLDEMNFACGLRFIEASPDVSVDDFRCPSGALPELSPALVA
jgi:hypothetical protein